MNNDNYEYLKEQLKMTGFGGLEEQLKVQMQKGEGSFQLEHQLKYGDKEINFGLNFRKSNTTDRYFFNSYTAGLAKENEYVSNTFYVDQRITAKEAFNLLDGRSVEKKYNHHEKIEDGEKTIYKPIKDSTYLQWKKLDFNDADENGNFKMLAYGEKWGFNLEETLAKLPIKYKEDSGKTELMASLKKGNLQSVTFEKNGIAETRYIEANPKARMINVYDSNLELIKSRDKAMNVGSDEGEQKPAQKQKQDKPGDEEDEPAEKQEKKKSRSRRPA